VVQVVSGGMIGRPGELNERRHGFQKARHNREVLFDVRGEVQDATRAKHPENEVRELGGEQEALAVPGLPPRVREGDVNRVDAAGGDMVPKHDLRVAAAGFDVREITPRDPGRRVELVLAEDLDAEVAPVRVSRRRGEKKHTLTEADFDLDG